MVSPLPAPNPARHSFLDDCQGLAYGSFMAAIGVLALTQLGLVTGQTAGLALLIAYAAGLPFGPVFFAINLPFYVFGYLRFGPVFTLKSFIAVSLLTILSSWLPGRIGFAHLDPTVGAILAGAASGSALIALFRHGASLGGIGIVALMLQDRTGFRAGLTQLLVDAAIFTLALLVLPLDRVGWSFLGAAVVNLMVAINHRRDRYVA